MAFVYPENLTAPPTQLEISRSLPPSSSLPSNSTTAGTNFPPSPSSSSSSSSSVVTSRIPHPQDPSLLHPTYDPSSPLRIHSEEANEANIPHLSLSPTHSYHELYLYENDEQNYTGTRPKRFSPSSLSPSLVNDSIHYPSMTVLTTTVPLAPHSFRALTAPLPFLNPSVIEDGVAVPNNTEPVSTSRIVEHTPTVTVEPDHPSPPGETRIVTSKGSITSSSSVPSSLSSSSSTATPLLQHANSIDSSILPASTKSVGSSRSTETKLPDSVMDTSDSGMQGDADSPVLQHRRNNEIRKWMLNNANDQGSSNYRTLEKGNNSKSIETTLPPPLLRTFSSPSNVTRNDTSGTLFPSASSFSVRPPPASSSSSSTASPPTVAEALNAVPVPGGVRIQVTKDKAIILGECIPSYPLRQCLPDWAYGNHQDQLNNFTFNNHSNNTKKNHNSNTSTTNKQTRWSTSFTCLQPWEEYDDNRIAIDPFLQKLQSVSKEAPPLYVPSDNWERAVIEAKVSTVHSKDKSVRYDLKWTGPRPWEPKNDETTASPSTENPGGQDSARPSIISQLSLAQVETSRQQYQQYLDRVDRMCNPYQLPKPNASVNTQILRNSNHNGSTNGGKNKKENNYPPGNNGNNENTEERWLHMDDVYPLENDGQSKNISTNRNILDIPFPSAWESIGKVLRTADQTVGNERTAIGGVKGTYTSEVDRVLNDSPGEFHFSNDAIEVDGINVPDALGIGDRSGHLTTVANGTKGKNETNEKTKVSKAINGKADETPPVQKVRAEASTGKGKANTLTTNKGTMETKVSSGNKAAEVIVIHHDSEVQSLEDSEDDKGKGNGKVIDPLQATMHGAGISHAFGNSPTLQTEEIARIPSISIPIIEHTNNSNSHETSWVSTVPPTTDLSNANSGFFDQGINGGGSKSLSSIRREEDATYSKKGSVKKSVSIASDRTDIIELSVDPEGVNIGTNVPTISNSSTGVGIKVPTMSTENTYSVPVVMLTTVEPTVPTDVAKDDDDDDDQGDMVFSVGDSESDKDEDHNDIDIQNAMDTVLSSTSSLLSPPMNTNSVPKSEFSPINKRSVWFRDFSKPGTNDKESKSRSLDLPWETEAKGEGKRKNDR